MKRRKLYPPTLNLVNCKCQECEIPVRQGLAYTPADMEKMTARGMPISTAQYEAMYNDGSENPSFHIESYRVKNVDVAELWEEREVIKAKARKAAQEYQESKTS